MERVIVEEELRADPVCPGIDLRLKMIHALERVRCVGVSLGETCNTDSEWMPMLFCKDLNVSDEVGSKLEIALRHFGAFRRRIAAQRQNRLDAGFRIPLENLVDLVPPVPHAREMRYGGEAGLVDQAFDKVVGAIPRRSGSAIGDGDEGRLERHQFADSTIQRHPTGRGRWREELEGDGRGAAGLDLCHTSIIGELRITVSHPAAR